MTADILLDEGPGSEAGASASEPRPALRRRIGEAVLGRGDNTLQAALSTFLATDDAADLVGQWFGSGLATIASRADPEALRRALDREIAALDSLLNDQVDTILHHGDFQRLEASWRGVSYVLDSVGEDERVRVRLLSVTWEELARDFDRAPEFDQSQLFTKVYSEEYGMPGGIPYGLLLCDYTVRHRRLAGAEAKVDDITTMAALSQVAAAAFAPAVIGAAPELFGVDTFAELSYVQNFEAGFVAPEYQRWRRLQQREDNRFIGIVLPRILLRDGWKDDGARRDGFRYREGDGYGADQWLWGNGVYAFGAVAIRAFRDWGWFADTRGTRVDLDDAGLVTNLPAPMFSTGEACAYRRPLEVELADKKQKALEELGFIALSPCRMTPFAAFLGMPSSYVSTGFVTQPVEAANGRLSSMLQYVLCVSRFAHYIKVMARDRVGAFTTAAELQRYLLEWLRRYMVGNEDAGFELKARYPLSGGGVEVTEIPGKPGIFACTIHLQPHFQIDQIVTAFRLQTEVQGLKAA